PCPMQTKYYYPQPNASTWDDARHFCQLCFKDLVSITPRNAELVVQNLTSELYWIGLRRNISGAIPWTQWSDNAPVTYQNWYPGHPVPKKQSVSDPLLKTFLYAIALLQYCSDQKHVLDVHAFLCSGW
uniref:C-type lectin domain-containing protein n=1 Tax=Electrophorus electricus TaxID=8005 RepID=A0A4W4GV94_ELEEL